MQSTAPTRPEVDARTPSLWSRFLTSVLPTPDPNRLVRVAEVSRHVLPLVEGSLADVEMSPVVQEIRGNGGDSRFMILVSAEDAEIASEVLAGV